MKKFHPTIRLLLIILNNLFLLCIPVVFVIFLKSLWFLLLWVPNISYMIRAKDITSIVHADKEDK